jgi:hypothetical protein
MGATVRIVDVTGEAAPNQRFKQSGHQFPLDDTTDVQATTWIPSEMAIPMILTSPER